MLMSLIWAANQVSQITDIARLSKRYHARLDRAVKMQVTTYLRAMGGLNLEQTGQ